ncbi:MAG: PQQ-binding-like beta-propeller repeat protein [Planctomycetaceae bacterium]|nr:PQQ-binding-like beta-propeller repeat protein [Planctomycetaceae bacterium]
MQKNEFSAWTLLLVALVLGSISTVTLGGCKPADEVDVDAANVDPPETATTENEAPPTETATDETATDETATDETATDETATDETTPEASSENTSANPDASSDSTDQVAAVGEAAPTAPESASTLVAKVAEDYAPKQIMEAGGDWPQWGGTREKNNVPGVKEVPLEWNIGKFDRRTGEWDASRALNINWFANLGSQTYGNPVVAGGRVFVGTNNGAGHLKRYPSKVDLGCLLAFDEATGEFLWQHSSEKLITGRVHDWPLQGICCAPLVEGDRMWFVTSRGEVRCLDTDGFYDDEDDGPITNEMVSVAAIMNAGPAAAGHAATLEGLAAGTLSDAAKKALADAGSALEGEATIETVEAGKHWKVTGNFDGVQRTLTVRQIGPRIKFMKALGVNDKRDADVIWVYDMMGPEMGISQHNMCSCSVTSYGDLLLVNTGNGLDESHYNLPAPDAPSFLCMDKNTGEVLWTDRSPAKNILHGQWSSPTVGVFDGVPQVLFAGGDGILYSFVANRGNNGEPELLWKFDCNPKTSKWILGGEGTRNNLIATPVAYGDYVYIAVGQDPEHGEGEGHLWCINPTMRGDISPTLAVKIDEEGKRVPIAHKRIQAVEEEKGEIEIDNPNSGVVWHYSMNDGNEDGEIDFEEEMHRTIGTVAIKDDVLYVADFSGLVHCLDANGTDDGMPIVHFTYDMLAQSWGSPLIAADHVFIGDEDGDVAIFEFGAENVEPIDEINMGSSVYSTPVAANDKLFISTKDKLFSIGIKK